jgi:hypothetical protein
MRFAGRLSNTELIFQTALLKYFQKIVKVVGIVAAVCLAPGSGAGAQIGDALGDQIHRFDKFKVKFLRLLASLTL